MATPSHDSTGFYSSFTFPGYTPPPGAPAKYDVSQFPTTSRHSQSSPRHDVATSPNARLDGMVNSHYYVNPEPSVTLRRAPAPPPLPQQGVSSGVALPRTNSPIYAPAFDAVRALDHVKADSHRRRSSRKGRHTTPTPLSKHHHQREQDSAVIYSKRHGSTPRLVSATTRVASRVVPLLSQHVVRTPSPQPVMGDVATSEQRPSSVPRPQNLDGGEPLNNVLKTFNDECRELLSMLDPASPAQEADSTVPLTQEVPKLGTVEARQHRSEDEDRRAACVVAPADLDNAVSVSASVDPDRLAIKWCLFLVDSRLQQLDRIRQHEQASAAPTSTAIMAEAVALETATKAAFSAREALLSLQECVASLGTDGVQNGDFTQLQQCKQLCTAVSNGLASMALAENDVLATVLGCTSQSHSSLRPGRVGDAAANNGTLPPSGSIPCASSTSAGSSSNSVAEAHDELGRSHTRPIGEANGEALKEELKTSVVLLRELQAENAALREELQGAIRKREKTKRHLKREREEKAEIAKHFDVVAGDNAELHRRVRQLEEEVAAATMSQWEGEAPTQANSEIPPQAVAEEHTFENEDALPEDCSRLKSQLERQIRLMRDLRDELLAAERENDTLRNTVAYLRDSLVRHRTVIDLLTRDQLTQSPLPKLSESRCSPRPGRGPSMQLIEGILAGTVSVPSSSVLSAQDAFEMMNGHHSCNSSNAFDDGPEYELPRV